MPITSHCQSAPTDIQSEDGNYIVCQVGKPSSINAAYSQKPQLYSVSQPFSHIMSIHQNENITQIL
jgi:hypothetical protein